MADDSTATIETEEKPVSIEDLQSQLDAVSKQLENEKIEKEKLDKNNKKLLDQKIKVSDKEKQITEERNAALEKEGKFSELAKEYKSQVELSTNRTAELEKELADTSGIKAELEEIKSAQEKLFKTKIDELTENQKADLLDIYPDFETMKIMERSDRLERFLKKQGISTRIGSTGAGSPVALDKNNLEEALLKGHDIGFGKLSRELLKN